MRKPARGVIWMNIPIVEVKHINKSFSGNKVLHGIDFTINAGEIVALVGENGCGKSTLIKIISGYYSFDHGNVTLNGTEYKSLTPTDSIKEGIQVIYQDFSVFPNLSVAENISLGIEMAKGGKVINWNRMRKNAVDALDKIGYSLDVDEEVEKLDVAEKQIVAISRAILQDAKVIIMDEPTTTLTQREILKLFEIILGLKKKGIAVIFISHKLDEVFEVCDRITVIRNGRKIVDQSIEEFDKEQLSFHMTGQNICEEPFAYQDENKECILSISNISAKGAFKNISFDLNRGEILGITGQLGSGRTSLAKALFGIIQIDSGEISIKGKQVSLRNVRDALKYNIAYLPEDRLTEGLFLSRSLKDNINSVVVDQQTMRFGLIDKKKLHNEAERWIKALNVKAPSVNIGAFTFSGGNQQRIVLSKWLASKPEIFVLNCPTVGVDIKSKSEIHTIIKELASEGMGVILISDDIGELLCSTNRILVMNSGILTYSVNTHDTNYEILSEKITELTPQ
jgi:simple sugar transport system ATP-binding protein